MLTCLIALATAVLLDGVLGDPPNRFHPVAAMGSLIRWAARRWNNGSPERRFVIGAGLTLGGGALFSLPWLLLSPLWSAWPPWAQGLWLGLWLKPTLAFRRLLEAGQAVQQALARPDLPEARRLVALHLVSRDTGQLSPSQVASATIESLAENLTDSFFSPLLCFAIGGLPLAWLYRFVNTADAMIGYHTPEWEHFGKFAARLDDLLNGLLARLAGLCLVLAAGLCRLDTPAAWKTMRRQHGRTGSLNAGWTMAAAAGALGLTLEKPGYYRLEGGPGQPTVPDIGRAARLVKTALALSLLCSAGVLVLRAYFF